MSLSCGYYSRACYPRMISKILFLINRNLLDHVLLLSPPSFTSISSLLTGVTQTGCSKQNMPVSQTLAREHVMLLGKGRFRGLIKVGWRLGCLGEPTVTTGPLRGEERCDEPAKGRDSGLDDDG